MAAPYPQFLPEAFAISAAGPDRNVIPKAPVTTQRASFDLGFPPLVMTPVVAGGKPMLGPDANGILYMLSTHSVYQQSGMLYRYSVDVSTAIGGYAIGTLLGSTDGLTMWFNTVGANVTDPDAGGAGWVAMWSYGVGLVTGLVGGTNVVPLATAAKNVIILSGALVANQAIVLPNQYRRWLIVNATSGAFTTTVKTASGGGVIVSQGGFNAPTEVWSDTINIYNVVAPVSLPIDQGPNPLTIVQRTNQSWILATYFNSAILPENILPSAVYFEAGSDNFIRKIEWGAFQGRITISNLFGQVTDAQVPQSAVVQHAAAVLTNPILTGVTDAPTPAPGTNDSQIATTAFVLANQLKVAAGRIIGGALQPGSIGVTSITPGGTGAYTIDVTAAGFTQIPNAVASIILAGANPDTAVIGASTTTSMLARTVFGATPVARDFNFVAIGL